MKIPDVSVVYHLRLRFGSGDSDFGLPGFPTLRLVSLVWEKCLV